MHRPGGGGDGEGGGRGKPKPYSLQRNLVGCIVPQTVWSCFSFNNYFFKLTAAFKSSFGLKRKEDVPGLHVSNYAPREPSNDFHEFIPKAVNSLAAHTVFILIQIYSL